jgi:Na+/proline symporter
MSDQRERERAKIDGQAAFAGAAYLMGVGLIFLLERVGAPDGLVRALGPLFALSGLALLGVLTRSTRVPGFFAADRAVPAPYAGLAFAAIAAGLIFCLGSPKDSPLPLAGVAIGLCISGLAVGPALRAMNASAPSDLLASRFPHPLLRLYFAGLMLAIGVLIAAAGYTTAVDAFTALFTLSRGAAGTIIAVILALMVVPGGLAGLLWGGAAGAGILIIILALPIAAQFFANDAAIAPLFRDSGIWSDALARAWGAGDSGDPATHWLVVLASALAVGALPPVASAAVGSFSGRHAARAGILGLIFAALIGLAVFIDLVLWPSSPGAMTSGLKSSAMLLAPLMLASAGVHCAARAWGARAGGGYERYMPLASQRLARSRALTLVVIALCAALTVRQYPEPKLAVLIAAALSLGLAAPTLALAFSARAASAHAAAGVLASVTTALVLYAAEGGVVDTGRLLIGALCAAAAGFIMGSAAAIFSPAELKTPPIRRDLFRDTPLDAGG